MNRAPTNNEVIICDEVVFLRTVLFFRGICGRLKTVTSQLEHKYSRLVYANILFLKINKFF